LISITVVGSAGTLGAVIAREGTLIVVGRNVMIIVIAAKWS